MAFAVAVSLCLLALAACSGGQSKKLIPPPPGSVAQITTSPPGSDFSGVALNPVEGRTTVPPVQVLGGEAVLTGQILGPDGPVGGATVRLERFVGDAVAKLDIISNADGTWRAPQVGPPTLAPPPTTEVTVFPGQITSPPTTAAPTTPAPTLKRSGPQGILGGRYRIRAWKAPDLALTTPQILFVEGKQSRTLPLQLARYTGTNVSSVTSPDPPVLGGVVSVTAVVSSASVDRDGFVRAAPLPNASVSLSVGPGWVLNVGPTSTNGQGRATFQLLCLALGQSPIELTVNSSQTFALPVRACVAPVTTTTSTLSLDPGGGSSTSLPVPGASSTTSSVQPPSP